MMAPIPANEQERLAALAAYDLLDTEPEQTFQDLTQLAAHVFQVPMALVVLVDRDRQWFKAKIGIEAKQTSRDVAFCAHTILGTELLLVPDARDDARFATNPLVTSSPFLRFYAGAPLITPDGYALGTFCVLDRVPRTLTSEQCWSLRILADQVMCRIELRRQVREVEQMAEERLQTETRLFNAPVRAIAQGQQADEALRKSQTKLAKAQRLAYIGSWEYNRQSQEFLWSEEVYRIFELDMGQGPPTYEELLGRYHPDDWSVLEAAVQNAYLHQQPFNLELRIISPINGSLRYIQKHGGPLVDEGGQVTSLVGMVIDITERKRTEEMLAQQVAELRLALEKAEQASRLKSEFVANMSHELRTPLNGVIGMTDLLLNTELTPTQRELAETAHTSAESLLGLINTVLDVSRIEASKQIGTERGAESQRLSDAQRTMQAHPRLASHLAPTPASEVRAPQPLSSPGVVPRILVVEDNAVNQRVVQLMLKKSGYQADVVANGREALSMLERAPYDLILMDCQMPEMDGYETTRRIRSLEQGQRHIPIIALTANTMQGDREKCLAAGMDDFLSKPIRLHDLLNVLQRYLPVAGSLATLVRNSDIEPPFPLSALTNRIGKDIAQLRAFAALLQDNVARLLTKCRQAAEASDSAALSAAAHTLKGVLMNLEASHAIDLTRMLERYGQEEVLPDAMPLLASLESEMARVTAHLAASIASLPE
jgi:CheY-like chemotaxis protein